MLLPVDAIVTPPIVESVQMIKLTLASDLVMKSHPETKTMMILAFELRLQLYKQTLLVKKSKLVLDYLMVLNFT